MGLTLLPKRIFHAPADTAAERTQSFASLPQRDLVRADHGFSTRAVNADTRLAASD
jgi:hypothetical protein